jgi:hypothetical protein
MATEKKTGNGKYFAGRDETWYSEGPFDTKEEAIEAFKTEYPDEDSGVLGLGEDFHLTPRADQIEDFIENLAENFSDECHEDALSDWCMHLPKGAYQELRDQIAPIFVEWLKKHGQDTFTTNIRFLDFIDCENDEDDNSARNEEAKGTFHERH